MTLLETVAKATVNGYDLIFSSAPRLSALQIRVQFRDDTGYVYETDRLLSLEMIAGAVDAERLAIHTIKQAMAEVEEHRSSTARDVDAIANIPDSDFILTREEPCEASGGQAYWSAKWANEPEHWHFSGHGATEREAILHCRLALLHCAATER